jgi:hypothetical protein
MRLLTLMQINFRPKLTNNSFFNRSTSSQSQCGHIPSSKSHSSSIGNGSSSGRYRESANSAGISFIATPTNSSTATLPNMTRSGLNYFTSLRNRGGICMFSYMLKKKLYRSNKSGHGVKYFRNIFFLLKESCYADVNILMDILVE